MHARFVLPLALCLLLSGCASVAPEPSVSAPELSAPTPEVSGPPAPQWGTQVYLTSFSVEDRLEPVFAPEYRLPQIKNAAGIPAYEAINAYYAAELDNRAAASSELSAWAVDDYKTSLLADFPFYTYVDTETYEITMETPTRVSILRSRYSATGVPAPVLFPTGDCFDLTTGQRLNFANLFSCPEEEARELVLSRLLCLNEAGAYANTVLDADALRASYDPEFFCLTEDSFVCYYPSGELPRAVGCPTFAIPYSELEEVLLPWQ